MRIVKGLLLVLIVLTAVLLGGGALLSPRFTVERSVTIAAPADKVYALIADPRQWVHWSVWSRRDPAMRVRYAGAASGAGASWSWESAQEGDGTMTFTAAEPGRRVAFDLAFTDFGTTSHGEFVLQPEDGATRVTWTLHGDMGRNPLLRWLALVADRMVGADFDAGLAGLKALAER